MAEVMGIYLEQYKKYKLYENLRNAATPCGSQYHADFGDSGKILQIPIVTDKGIFVEISGNYKDSIMLDGTIVPNATKITDNGEVIDEDSAISCMEIEDNNIAIAINEGVQEYSLPIADTENEHMAFAVEVSTIAPIDGIRLHKRYLNIQYVKKIYSSSSNSGIKLDIYKDTKCSPITRIGTIFIHKDSIDWEDTIFADPTIVNI
jgi:hypothetical protein